MVFNGDGASFAGRHCRHRRHCPCCRPCRRRRHYRLRRRRRDDGSFRHGLLHPSKAGHLCRRKLVVRPSANDDGGHRVTLSWGAWGSDVRDFTIRKGRKSSTACFTDKKTNRDYFLHSTLSGSKSGMVSRLSRAAGVAQGIRKGRNELPTSRPPPIAPGLQPPNTNGMRGLKTNAPGPPAIQATNIHIKRQAGAMGFYQKKHLPEPECEKLNNELHSVQRESNCRQRTPYEPADSP